MSVALNVGHLSFAHFIWLIYLWAINPGECCNHFIPVHARITRAYSQVLEDNKLCILFVHNTPLSDEPQGTSSRDALQSFASALLVAAPQTALFLLPSLLPPAHLAAHQRPALRAFVRTAPSTRNGTLLSVCSLSLARLGARMSFAGAYLGSLHSPLRSRQKSQVSLPLRNARPLFCRLLFLSRAHLLCVSRCQRGRLRCLCCRECKLFRSVCRSFALRTHFLTDARPAFSYRALLRGLGCSLFGRFHLLGFPEACIALAEIFAAFRFLLPIRLFWQRSRRKPLSPVLSGSPVLYFFDYFHDLESFTFASTVVFILGSPRTSCTAIEILDTLLCYGLARYFSPSDVDYFRLVIY